ncbi:hypothetical protein [Holdemania massiliensis]|uniref:hypothetical protein n=1 Tax=Holdemania massiliensis TaxID=1468449 RepID=UPI001F05272B|nr:hypothetical protein [Holdemania massiliensis]MCH1940391.1 hypothetical protein [Holdemania massiliensis]
MENNTNTSSFFQRYKLFIILGSVILVIAFIAYRMNYIDSEDYALKEGGLDKNAFVQELKGRAEGLGLKNVKINTTWNANDKIYDVIIESSNFENMSFEKMFSVEDGMHGRVIGENWRLRYFLSNGNKYDINSSSNRVKKNGQIIYDDYENSSTKETLDIYNSIENTYDYTSSKFTTAWDYAKKLAKASLKSPSSAKFQKSSELTMTCKGKSCSISAYVDADNSFGASIRTYFVVSFDMEVSVSGLATFTNAQCVFLE